jgi:hypothetical protein
MNNRSIGLDTECDIGVEATDDAARDDPAPPPHAAGRAPGVEATAVVARGAEQSPLAASRS